jgi:hypothetical protein
MIGLAHESMSNAVIGLEHAMKYARKARDFFRAYRCGAGGVGGRETEGAVQMPQVHVGVLLHVYHRGLSPAAILITNQRSSNQSPWRALPLLNQVPLVGAMHKLSSHF